MRLFIHILVGLAVITFSGCSFKKVFEPENVDGSWEHEKSLSGSIIDKTANAAYMDDGKVITSKKVYNNITLDENFRILGESGGYILSTNIKGDLKLHHLEDNKDITLHLDKTIAAASTDGEVVAVVYASGKLALFDLATQKILLVVEAQNSVALDGRIENPYFMNDLVLYLTLDGKIVIVNKELKKRLRTIIISSAEYFNNVIYFDIFQDKLIVATATKVLSFGKEQKRLDVETREITHDEDMLYIATKQGDILEVDSDLNIKNKAHFSFAHFLGLYTTPSHLYALEKEGYIIELSKDLLSYKIYDVDFDDEADVFTTQDGFIVGDEKIILPNDAN